MFWSSFFIGLLISLFHGWAAAQSLNLGQLIQLATESHPSVRAQLKRQPKAALKLPSTRDTPRHN